MADIADLANDLMLERLERQLAARPPAVAVLAAECEDCDDPIPEARLKALYGRGCLRCVFCQDRFEQRGGVR